MTPEELDRFIGAHDVGTHGYGGEGPRPRPPASRRGLNAPT